MPAASQTAWTRAMFALDAVHVDDERRGAVFARDRRGQRGGQRFASSIYATKPDLLLPARNLRCPLKLPAAPWFFSGSRSRPVNMRGAMFSSGIDHEARGGFAAVGCSLDAGASFAQSASKPFAGMAGVWSGMGSIALADGSKEAIRCPRDLCGTQRW